MTAHVFCHVLSRLSRDCACVLSCVVAFCRVFCRVTAHVFCRVTVHVFCRVLSRFVVFGMCFVMVFCHVYKRSVNDFLIII